MMNNNIHAIMLKMLKYFVGLNILALGTILFTDCHLGSSPLVSLPQVISNILPITLGQATTSIFTIFVIAELLIVKKVDLKILNQFVVAFMFGYIVDFYNIKVGLDRISPPSIMSQIITLLFAIIFTSFGVFLMIKTDFILNPPDGFVNTLCQKTRMSFGKTKILFDVSMVLLTLVMSLLFIHHVSSIGIGTLLAVLLVGNLVNFWNAYFSKHVV